jgi:hypothetical protein
LRLFGRKIGKAIDQLGLMIANLFGMNAEAQLDRLIGSGQLDHYYPTTPLPTYARECYVGLFYINRIIQYLKQE